MSWLNVFPFNPCMKFSRYISPAVLSAIRTPGFPEPLIAGKTSSLYKSLPALHLKWIWQPPAFPCRLQHSIIGRPGLDHRVRDVYGYFPWAHRHQNDAITLATQQQTDSLLASLRKEVIQPHLPIRLPCYDFTPVTGPAFGSSLLAVGSLTSGISGSHGVTGGVYKTRERIHRGILIRDY